MSETYLPRSVRTVCLFLSLDFTTGSAADYLRSFYRIAAKMALQGQ